MNDSKAYQLFKEQNGLPIYLEDWFLDLACYDGKWKSCSYVEDGIVLGLFFYFIKKKWGLNYITMPTMVKYMGPVFSAHIREDEKQKILESLRNKIPSNSYFIQQWMPRTSGDILNKIITSNYKLRETFIWDIDHDEAYLLREMDGNYRRAINKYSHELSALGQKKNLEEIDMFIHLLEAGMGPLEEHGLSKEVLIKMIHKLETKESGKLIIEYKEEDIVGGCLVCWDAEKAYYLFAGNNKKHNKIYPGVQMAWKTILYLKENTTVKKLDFLGSSIPSIAKIWSKLGADKYHYPIIEKEAKFVFSVLNKIKNIWNKK